MIFQYERMKKVKVVGILQNTIIFANNDDDEEKNESAASNYVFQCSQ